MAWIKLTIINEKKEKKKGINDNNLQLLLKFFVLTIWKYSINNEEKYTLYNRYLSVVLYQSIKSN